MAAAIEQDELLPADAGVVPEQVVAERVIITRPGLYDIPEMDYHRDPVPGGSLSSSVAKKLIGECPAVVKHDLEHPPGHKDAWDLGSVVHARVLGRGERGKAFPGAWNTNKIKAEIAEARAAGLIPMKPENLATAERMAAAVMADPDAARLFAEGTGLAERTIVWTHERTGTPLRSMLDWLRFSPVFPPTIVDLKSTKDVSRRGVQKAVAEYRYFQQDPFYRAAVASLGFDVRDVGFVFVFVGSAPPHLVTVTVLDEEALAEGMACNEDAIDQWVQCQDTGIWPPYATDIVTTSLPNYALRH